MRCRRYLPQGLRQVAIPITMQSVIFVWVNDSDHKITLFVESDLGCEFKNEVILPGESFTAMDNGMGVCPVPSSYIWKMTIIFDDGRLGFTYGVRYYQDDGRSYPPNYDAHYDPSIDDNYVFEDLRVTVVNLKSVGLMSFTNADYECGGGRWSRSSK